VITVGMIDTQDGDAWTDLGPALVPATGLHAAVGCRYRAHRRLERPSRLPFAEQANHQELGELIHGLIVDVDLFTTRTIVEISLEP
jgi:hypothetical protein